MGREGDTELCSCALTCCTVGCSQAPVMHLQTGTALASNIEELHIYIYFFYSKRFIFVNVCVQHKTTATIVCSWPQ